MSAMSQAAGFTLISRVSQAPVLPMICCSGSDASLYACPSSFHGRYAGVEGPEALLAREEKMSGATYSGRTLARLRLAPRLACSHLERLSELASPEHSATARGRIHPSSAPLEGVAGRDSDACAIRLHKQAHSRRAKTPPTRPTINNDSSHGAPPTNTASATARRAGPATALR